MSERSPTHEASRSAPSSIARKASKTSEPSSATPSGLNADFSRVPASTSAIQRVAMDEGGGGGLLVTPEALAALPPEVQAAVASVGEPAGLDRRKRGEFDGTTPESYRSARWAGTTDVENPRHVTDRRESDKTGFDTVGNTSGNTGDREGPRTTGSTVYNPDGGR